MYEHRTAVSNRTATVFRDDVAFSRAGFCSMGAVHSDRRVMWTDDRGEASSVEAKRIEESDPRFGRTA